MFFLLILYFICLKFLDQKPLLQLFLNCETLVRFLSHFIPRKILFYCHADSLALSCIEVCILRRRTDVGA